MLATAPKGLTTGTLAAPVGRRSGVILVVETAFRASKVVPEEALLLKGILGRRVVLVLKLGVLTTHPLLQTGPDVAVRAAHVLDVELAARTPSEDICTG